MHTLQNKKEKITYKFVVDIENDRTWWVWKCYGEAETGCARTEWWMCQCMACSDSTVAAMRWWKLKSSRAICGGSSKYKSYKSLNTLYRNHLSNLI